MIGAGWQAHLAEDWARDGTRLHVARRIGLDGRMELITGWDEYGAPVLTHLDALAVHEHPGFLLPRDALVSIAEQLRPGPSPAEVARLEAALTIEQDRVDLVLRQMLVSAAEWSAAGPHRAGPTDDPDERPF